MNYRDPSGNIIETIADIASTVWDVVELVKEPSWKGVGYVLWDVASVVIPIMPASYVNKAAKGAKSALNALDAGGDIARWGKKVVGFFKGAGGKVSSFFTRTVLPKLDDLGKWAKGLDAVDEAMDAARAAGRWLNSKGDDLLKLYDKLDGWLAGKATKGLDRLIDVLDLSDGAEDFLRMIQREFCQADNLYNRIHRGQQAADAAADSVRAAGGTLDELDDIGQEIAEEAAKADKLPARKDPGSTGGVGAIGGDIVKPDFYVTPSGDTIPANKGQFEHNLSLMDNIDGKYVGESSGGPVRIEGPHPLDENFNGNFGSDHFIDHIHIEHRKNGLTGPWGKDRNNKIMIPLNWIDGD